MRLLFDNNLSHRLVARLLNNFPNSSHVMFKNMDDSDDLSIWEFAKNNKFTIVTKDNDFHELSVIKGFPPKVIWLNTGNCKISIIEDILKGNREVLLEFNKNNKLGFIEICY
ncbi:hypothetical protein MNBD_GAMMA01-1882 [hydrothermal vent metagenome]|uniref:DUF5615 domain-containing protein n=1 Tax=hydrothermal vent metagenome TaxID=652676 RepID=A0A3B0WF79_9ZZZZ